MILRGHIFSQVLEKETALTVVVPNESRPGPKKLVYLLHGLCGSSGDWVDNTLLPLYAQTHDVMFVLPEGGRSFYADMVHGGRFLTHLVDELPALCRQVFQITSERLDTAIMGASMGGYGALKAAFTRPEQYGFCGAFAPPCLYLRAFLEQHRQPSDEVRLRELLGAQLLADFKAAFGDPLQCPPAEDLPVLAQNARGRVGRLYLACGAEDSFLAENRSFGLALKEMGVPHQWEVWAGGHDWHFFNEALRRALGVFVRA